MKFILERSNSPDRVQRFLDKNGVPGRATTGIEGNVEVFVDDSRLSSWQSEIVARHFSFYDIVDWSEVGVENILLWEHPNRWEDVVSELVSFFPSSQYDSIATAEARGFIVAGAISAFLKKPLISVRKFKPIYESLPGHKTDYINWKSEKESLYIFHRDHFQGRRCLFIDDVFQRGHCLKACLELLTREGISVVGGFHLCDAAEPGARDPFTFPLRSLLRFDDLFGNTRPAL